MARKWLVLFLLLPLLAGCWNKTELEEMAHVLAVGIDKGDQGPYRITVMIAKPDKLAGKDGGGGGESPVLVATVQSPSLSSARVILNGLIGRRVSFLHTRGIMVHEELAREEGWPLLDEMLRFRQLRETAFMIVTRQPAAEYLKEMKAALGSDPFKQVEQMTYLVRRTAALPSTSQLSAFTSVLNSGYGQPVTYYSSLTDKGQGGESGSSGDQAEAPFRAGQLPQESDASIEMIGAAAFRGPRMVGVLDGEDTRYLLMLQNKFYSTSVAFKDPRAPDQYVSVQLSRGRPTRVVVQRLGEKPLIRVDVTLEAQILAIQSGIDYTEPETQGELERAMAEQIEDKMKAFIARTQDWETDIVGFGRHAISRFGTVGQWEAYDWPKRYPNAEIQTDVTVTLRRFGLTLSPVQTAPKGGEE